VPRSTALLPGPPKFPAGESPGGEALQGKPDVSHQEMQEKPKLTPSGRGEGDSSICWGAMLPSLAWLRRCCARRGAMRRNQPVLDSHVQLCRCKPVLGAASSRPGGSHGAGKPSPRCSMGLLHPLVSRVLRGAWSPSPRPLCPIPVPGDGCCRTAVSRARWGFPLCKKIK